MAENSKIEWTTHTFNPWIGCTKVSPGCDRCYAEQLMDVRYGRVKWGPHGERVRTSPANWKLPLRWAKAAREARARWEMYPLHPSTMPPERPRVFCASLADVFDNQVPELWRSDLFALIEDTPELDWLLLTKRPENVMKMIWPKWDNGLPRNIWLGTTCEDQPRFNHRWPILQDVPASVRFISYEPAIGPLRIFSGPSLRGLHWLICGGESGPGFRYMDLEWAHRAQMDCTAAGVAFFMKQLAGKKPFPPEFHVIRQFPRAA